MPSGRLGPSPAPEALERPSTTATPLPAWRAIAPDAPVRDGSVVRAWLLHGGPRWWRSCLALWAAAFVVLSLTGLLAVRIVDMREGYDPVIGVDPYGVPGIWARWDSPYYLRLATDGYAEMPLAVGYFPVYPLGIRIVSTLTGLPSAWAGLVLAQVSYLLAILLFYRLARQVHDDPDYAWRSVTYLVLFPSSFFFLAVYAEPVTLVCSIATFLLLTRRDRPTYLPAGLAASIAVASRPVAILLGAGFAGEWLRRRDYRPRTAAIAAAGLALMVVGLAAYVVYLHALTGSWLAIPRAQARWGAVTTAPWSNYLQSVRVAIVGNGVTGDWFLYAMNAADLLFASGALALTAASCWLTWRGTLPLSLALYLAASLALILSQHRNDLVPLWGSARWVAALFPMYLVLARLVTSQRGHVLIAWIFAVGQCALFAWWSTGRWVG